jgi:hypothetical protein
MRRNVSGAARPAWRTPELIAQQPLHWQEKAEDWRTTASLATTAPFDEWQIQDAPAFRDRATLKRKQT